MSETETMKPQFAALTKILKILSRLDSETAARVVKALNHVCSAEAEEEAAAAATVARPESDES